MSQDVNSLVEQALARRPRGIISDIDGTLAPITETPDVTELAPGAREALEVLRDHLDVVAVVSGRSASDARALVGVPGIVVIGNHGLESITDASLTLHPDAEAAMPRMKEAIEALNDRIKGLPSLKGAFVEDKGASASVHFRLTPNRTAAEAILTEWVNEVAEPLDLRVTHGRMVVELRPPVDVNKGVAVRRIVDDYSLEGMLFLGDDVTDIDAFVAAQELRAERDLATWSIAIADPEARRDVVDAADAAIRNVATCVRLLESIGERLRNE